MKKIRPSLIPGFICLAICTFLLTMPGTAFPKENWLDKIGFDKWVHIGLFAIMVVLFCWAMLRKKKRQTSLRTAFIWVAVAGLAYGIAMEFVQKYCVVNRSFDKWDIVADGVGCLGGLLFSTRRYIKK